MYVCQVKFSILSHIHDLSTLVNLGGVATCRRTGSVRPTTGPVKRDRHCHVLLRHKRKPPRGMYINHDDLVAMAAGPPAPAPASQGDQMLKAMDREIVSLKRQVSLLPTLLLAHDDEKICGLCLYIDMHKHPYCTEPKHIFLTTAHQ